jgi:peptide chain release factor 1
MDLAPAIVAKLRERARRFEELTAQLADAATIADPRRYPALLRERGQLEHAAELARRLDELARRRSGDERILAEERDEELVALAREDLEALEPLEAELDAQVRNLLVAEPEDERRKVIVEIRAGTGGDEATLFAADLARIYRRYFDARGWRVEDLGSQPSEVGGFKELVLAVEGEHAWRRLRFESGGHRVQRVPETEAQGRIHTSAVTVAVLPEAEEAEIEVRPEDLRIDTMRAGGAGGQHVNKTESAVRITHLPTNTVVVCQDEKSQHKNKARAMRILKSRLLENERQRLHAQRAAARRTLIGSGDRNERVRTYNWPQSRVTDHRLNENYSLEQVLAGRLDPLLAALDELEREERIKNL